MCYRGIKTVFPERMRTLIQRWERAWGHEGPGVVLQ